MTVESRRYDSLSSEDTRRFLEMIPATGVENPRFLEIGSASGNFSAALAERERSPRMVGIDVDHATLITYNGFRVLADGAFPPFRNGSFDVIIFSSALHHVMRVERTLEASARMLRSGGMLLLMEPNARYPLRFPENSPWRRIPGLVTAIQRCDDPAFVAEELSDFLGRHGVRTEAIHYFSMKGASPGWRSRLQYGLFHLLGARTPRWLHPWFLYVGRKK